MSFKEIEDTAQAVAISERLSPTFEYIWNRYCRVYSELFNEPLSLVLAMDPYYVCHQVFSSKLDKLDLDDNIENIQDIIASLEDPNYDINKERAYREQMKRIEDEEELRVKEGRAVHESLEKENYVFKKEEPTPEMPKDLPKSGGLNMNLINQLKNDDRES